MFPIPWNKLFRKKDGSIVTIDEAISSGGGGGYILPTASADTKGGVKVGPGMRMTGEVLDRSDFIAPAYDSKMRPFFKDSNLQTGKYVAVARVEPVNVNPQGITFNEYTVYDLDEVYLPANSDVFEYYQPITADFIAALSLDTLYDGESSGTSVETSASILDYDVIVLKGCYNSNGASSNYDTTMLYTGPELNHPYWFGVKDRNSSYCGLITFTDGTHATIDYSRTIKIYGYKFPSNSRKRKKK